MSWRGGAAFALSAASVAVLIACASTTETRDPVEESLSLFMRARVAREQGEPGRAVVLLDRAATLAPESAPIAAALGDAQLAMGEDAAARVALERAVALDEDDAVSLVLLARLDIRAHQPADALERLLEFEERTPGRKAVLDLLHPLLLWSGDVERGLEVFERTLEFAPDLAIAHEARGDFLSCQGHEDEALASYRRALALEPGRRAAELKAAQLLSRKADELLRRLPPPPAPADPGVDVPAAPDAPEGSR